MPALNGLELLKNLTNRPAVIMTTAYREYAAEGFDLDVVDYLLKPIAFPRFLKAVNKVSHTNSLQDIAEVSPAESKPDSDETLWLKVDKKIVPVMMRDILFIQSLKDYVRVVTPEKKLITYHTLQSLLEKLSSAFIRIHKSYIVQVSKISSIEGNIVHVGKEALPLGRSYKNDLLNVVKSDRNTIGQ
jgi:DNA-binding LytR/AlgR family response regulator